MREVTIPFTFFQSRAEIAVARPPFGSCVYIGGQKDAEQDWQIARPGATIDFRSRIRQHDPAWEGYMYAYPGQDLADLVYPYALAYYQREPACRRKGRLSLMSPEEAAACDVRVVGPADRGTGSYGIHYRLEHLVARYVEAHFGTLEHWSGDTEHSSRRIYMRPLQFRFEGDLGIVSADA
jgi:hypothetical protein